MTDLLKLDNIDLSGLGSTNKQPISVDNNPATQPRSTTVSKLFDSLDPEVVPLKDREAPALPKTLKQLKVLDELGGRFGIQGEPKIVNGVVIPPKASLPITAREAGAGLIEGATFGLVELPDIPDETPGQAMVRDISRGLGAILPFTKLAGGIAAGVKAVGLTGKAAFAARGLLGATATTGIELTREQLHNEEISRGDLILQAGINTLFFGLYGPKEAARQINNIVIKNTPTVSGATARAGLGKVVKTKSSQVPKDERDLVRAFGAAAKHIAPGEVDFNEVQKLARLARSGVRIENDMFVTNVDMPQIERILKGTGLTRKEVRDIVRDPEVVRKRFGLGAKRKINTRARGAIATSNAATNNTAAGGVAAKSPVEEINAAADELRPVDELRAAMKATRAPAGGASGETITTPSGQVMTVERALRRRGRPRRRADASGIAREDVGPIAKGKSRITYFDAENNKVGSATFVKLVNKGKGTLVNPLNGMEFGAATAGNADFLVVETNFSPGYSDAVVVNLQARGIRFFEANKATQGNVRGLVRRLGGKGVRGTPDVLEMTDIREMFGVRGGVGTKDPVGIDQLLKPRRARAPKQLRVGSSIRPRESLFNDMEEAMFDPELGRSTLRVRTGLFDPIERLRLRLTDATLPHDNAIASMLRGTSRKTRRSMMDVIAGTPVERANALSSLSTKDINAAENVAQHMRGVFKNDFGMDFDAYVNDVIPAVRQSGTADLRVAFANREIPENLKPLLQYVDESHLVNPLERDIARFAGANIHTGFFNEILQPGITAAKRFVNSKEFPVEFKPAVSQYINSLTGTKRTITKGIGKVYRRMWQIVGEDVSEDEAKNIVSNVVATTHSALLGFRIAPVIRNIVSGMAIGGSRVGNKWYRMGMRLAATAEGRALYNEANGFKEGATILDALSELTAGRFTRANQRLARVSLKPYQSADRIPRVQSFLGQYARVKDAAAGLPAGASDDLFMRRAGLYRYHPVIRREVVQKFRNEGAEAAARLAGIHAERSTQWAYRPGFRPSALDSETGKLFGMFGVWPANYLEMIRQMKTLPMPPKERAKWFAEFMLNNTAVISAFASSGAAVGIGLPSLRHTLGWTLLGPLNYTGGPPLELGLSLGGVAYELSTANFPGRSSKEVFNQMRQTLIPGASAVRDIRRSLGAGSAAKPKSEAEAMFRVLTGAQPREQ